MADNNKPQPGIQTDRNLALELVRVTEAAAIAASHWIGHGKKNEADGAAVEAMRKAFDAVAIDGTVVIGEGEMDEAPMLYHRREGGCRRPGDGHCGRSAGGHDADRQGRPECDGDDSRWPSSGNFLHAPDIYMDKIAVGGGLPPGVVNLDDSVATNLRNLARAKRCDVSDLIGLHPGSRPPQGTDRPLPGGRCARHADQRRRRGRRDRHGDAGCRNRHLPGLRRRAGGRAGRGGAALRRRPDAGAAAVRDRTSRSSGCAAWVMPIRSDVSPWRRWPRAT